MLLRVLVSRPAHLSSQTVQGHPSIVERILVFSLCLDTRQPGTVFKKLDARQSEIFTNFLGIARLIPLKTQDICLEISNECKYCLLSLGIEWNLNVFDTY